MRTVRSAALVATASMLAFSSASLAQTGVSNAGTGGQAPVAIPNEPPSEPPQAGDENPVTAAVREPEVPAASGVQDIIVTATRRSANLQTVPLAVTAIQANELSAQGLKTVADLPRMVPGLSTTRGSASTNIYLRGVGTSSSGFNTETPIATYLDGYYLPNTASTLFSFNNIERVEVLKGPQGTLYGRNATGGLVNVITREPGRDTRVDASIGYGNYDTLSLNFYGSTPVSDTVSTGVAFTHTKQSDGWGRNVFTGNDNMKFRETGVQGKVRWEPSDATRVTLEGMYVDISSDQGLVDGITPGSRGTDGTPFLGRYLNSDRRDGNSDSSMYLAGLKIEQDVGFASFVSLTGYSHAEAVSEPNLTGQPGMPVAGRSATNAILTGDSDTFSQEFQLSSQASSSSPFSWIAGLFYLHDNTVVGTSVFSTCVGTVCAPTPIPTQTTGRPTTRSYAAYAEGTYEILPATRVTLGARYTRDKKALTGNAVPLPGFPNSVTTLPATVVRMPGDPYAGNPNGIDTEITFPKLTYKAVLAHDVTDDIHAYVSYNRGFKSGSFQPTNFNNEAARPEVLDAFEAGVKSDLFDRLLRLNVSGFHYKYKDIQLRTGAPPAPPGSTIIYNAAAARVNGVDIQANLVPSRALSINASATYLDATYSKFPNASCTVPRTITATVLGGNNTVVGCDNSGNRMINTPRWSYNLNATYTVETGIGDFALSANDSYKSRSFWDPDNRLSQNSYHLVSASLTWTSPSKTFDIQAYVRNLTKSFYFANILQSGTDVGVVGAPRTYGVNVGVHF